MYGNAPFGADVDPPALTSDERRALRRDLSTVAARTRDLLPGDFAVGAEITATGDGTQARIAVQPPRGSMVSAAYTPSDGQAEIPTDELDDLVHGLAASAALQEKRAFDEGEPKTAG